MITEIIKNELLKNSENKVAITYECHTTSSNSEFIIIKIGETEWTRIEGSSTTKAIKDLETAVESLKADFPEIHLVAHKHEFHFYYHGFNSCSTRLVPIEISCNPESQELKKDGVVSEKFQLIGKKKVLEIIDAHPGYQLYKRVGFAFKGSQEGLTTREDLIPTLDWMCCADVDILDHDKEIHVNCFSYSDMD